MKLLQWMWQALFGKPVSASDRWLTVRDFLQEQGLDASGHRCQGFGRTAMFLCRKRGVTPGTALQGYAHRKGKIPVRSYPESLLLEALDHQTTPKEVK